jgi:sensor histidine kinase YesM
VDWSQVLFTSIDWLLYALFTPGVFALARRWPLARPRLVGHGIVHLVASLGFCVAWAGLGTALKMVLLPHGLDDVPRAFASWVFITLPFGVAVYLALVGIEHAIRYFVEAREHESRARLAVLEAQLNPHFLFNALNTVTVLVRDGERAPAARIVEQLAGLLRQTLAPERGSEVALADELALVKGYLAIEEARYSDRLAPRFEIAEPLLGLRVPSFALQQLVENAIRHGIARRTGAGELVVTARQAGNDLELLVEDDGAGIAAGMEFPPGHGLHGTRERLRVLYGERASLVVEPRAGGGTVARLRIPVRDAG